MLSVDSTDAPSLHLRNPGSVISPFCFLSDFLPEHPSVSQHPRKCWIWKREVLLTFEYSSQTVQPYRWPRWAYLWFMQEVFDDSWLELFCMFDSVWLSLSPTIKLNRKWLYDILLLFHLPPRHVFLWNSCNLKSRMWGSVPPFLCGSSCPEEQLDTLEEVQLFANTSGGYQRMGSLFSLRLGIMAG